MFKIRAIDHVTLFVSDVASIQPYYEQVFGFACTLIDSGGQRVLQLETDRVHFFFNEEKEISAEIISKQHISFAVLSLEPVIQQLKLRGESYKTGTYNRFATRNYHWCEWLDPAGIRVECIEHL